jgi:phage terminase large subunit-like protein
MARPKQLPPDHPRHMLADKNGYRCRWMDKEGVEHQCQGQSDWFIWLFMAGRGCGKTLAGANWVIEQALTYPGTRWAVVAPTYDQVQNVCFAAVDSGIRAQAQPGELVDYNKNNMLLTMSNGSEIKGFSAENPERVRGYNLAGAWLDEVGCLPGDALVRTEIGEKPIKDVRAGERVWTRAGLRRVSWSGPTRRNAELVELVTADGKSVRCTPDHRVWTNQGWKNATDVSPGDIMYAWMNLNSYLARPLGLNGTGSAGTGRTKPLRAARTSGITGTPAATCFTALSGNARTARSLKAWSCTTRTTTKHITGLTISNSSRMPLLTHGNIRRNGITLTGPPAMSMTRRLSEAGSSGVIVRPAPWNVLDAGTFSTPLECAPSTAIKPAGLATVVVSSGKLPYREPVTYDLTVEGEPEFYADGLLVHNSYRYRSIWDEVLQPALRKGDPRVIVTTTPSASPLLKEWYQRWLEHAKRGETCDIHLTAAIFKENDTLPLRRVEELERQYGGTRIGRQELEGEMLEDFEGAMWRREFIEAHRVREADFFHSNGKLRTELFSRIVVAVDPSMTSGERSDESGIVVAGQGVDSEAYIIADWSVNGTPEAVMGRAVAAYYEFYADCVVMEANQGGDYLTKALRTADANVPPRIVRASKGKLIRAQPVSMLAEQGRLHHIGVFQKLEDELCMMTPETDRLRHDDRADAMIWAISELRGITDGSWSEAYGWVYCNSCGHGFRRSYRKCPKCGHEIDPGSEAAVKRPGSWAAAYMNSCKKCGVTFPARERECPDCNPTASGYMSQVSQVTGRSNWLSYQQKNWLRGRRF